MVNYNESKEYNIALFPVRLGFCCHFASVVARCGVPGAAGPPALQSRSR